MSLAKGFSRDKDELIGIYNRACASVEKNLKKLNELLARPLPTKYVEYRKLVREVNGVIYALQGAVGHIGITAKELDGEI